MDTNQQLTFLQERIEEIGSAIFYNLSEAVLKLPTSIVNTVKMDEYGFVWFVVQRPTQRLNEFEQEFPVKMDFYKKGKGYFLQVAGKGLVVNYQEEMNGLENFLDDQKEVEKGSLALVKVKIQKAEYYETRSMQNTSWWQTAWTTMMTWFRHDAFRSGDMFFPAS